MEDAIPLGGLYPRELVRQAFLIAGRIELGLEVRDSLLETVADRSVTSGAIAITVAVAADERELNVKISREPNDGDAGLMLWETQIPLGESPVVDLAQLARTMEVLSRTEFVDILRKLGVEREGLEEQNAVPLASEIEALLGRMDCVSQFVCVQRLFRSMRESGEAESHLGELVRAYAHLSLLTRHSWNATSTIFGARAILYAERMLQTADDRRSALWHHAYACALTGMHWRAVADLEELDAMAEKTSDPAWGAIVRPLCDYDSDGLIRVGNETTELRGIAELLNFHLLVVQENQEAIFEAMKRVARICPQAYGVYPHAYARGALGIQRWAAASYGVALGRGIPRSMRAIEGLPEPIIQAASEPSRFNEYLDSASRVVEALIAEEQDAAEPSWRVMATMIQEDIFLSGVLQLYDGRNAVKGPLDYVVDMYEPHVKRHPYGTYISAHRFDRESNLEGFYRAVQDIQIRDPQPYMNHLFSDIRSVKTSEQPELGVHLYKCAHYELTAHSLLMGIHGTGDSARKALLSRHYEAVAPSSPIALVLAIIWTPDPSEEKLAEWSDRVGDDASANLYLGKAYLQDGDHNRAAHFLKKSIDVGPSLKAYSLLADNYWQQKDYDGWQDAMEGALTTENFGLEHANLRVRLAKGLMEIGRWADAEPFAAEAAETYAMWAMASASVCYEGLEQWDKSEEWMRRTSESYGNDGRMWWYFWCRRTGRGDLASAKRLARTFAETIAAPDYLQPSIVWTAGVYYLLEGDQRKAFELFQRSNEALGFRGSSWFALMTAYLADETGHVQARDEVLAKLERDIDQWKHDGNERDEAVDNFVGALIECLQAGSPDEDGLATMEKAFEKLPLDQKQRHGYLVGKLFERGGNLAAAKRYWEVALDGRYKDKLGVTLAGAELVRLNAEEAD